MHISEKTLQTLEFDKIRELLAESALTEGARAMARSLMPSDREEEIIRRAQKTTDAKRLMNIKGAPSFGEVRDVSDACERSLKGAVLTPRELLDVADLLLVSRRLIEYIRMNRLFETVLDEIFERIVPNRQLEEKITRAIISEEMIADEASPALGDIRRKMRAVNVKIRDMLQHYTQSNDYSKYLQDNIVTMRNGRYVIPVRVECRGEIKGLVHDTSASGQTLFVEPIAVVEANNDLRELAAKEAREIEKILADMSDDVAKFSSALSYNYRNITELAFAFACAELSFRMNGNPPAINHSKLLKLDKARHPLINKDKVVPIDAVIGDGYDTIIITGPNTGGKTVTLKTFGLLALMAQSGLHIPAAETSSVCVFDRVLADIGDEQSIEQSLSTFSSHMVNIVSMLDEITDNSLVLFDELGVGTDPVEGAALAVSIIENVRENRAVCAATTHYAELKVYALNTEGVRNASCEFNVETLKPTYKLIIGTPGKSNAFAISEKLGIPSSIVSRAKAIISSDDRKFEDVIDKLERTRIEYEAKRAEAQELRDEYERFKVEAERRYNEKIAAAESEVAAARKKAAELINTARASSEFVFDQLEKAKRSSEELEDRKRAVRQHLRDSGDRLDPVEESDNSEYVLPRPLKKGDDVLIVNINKRAVVTTLPDKRGLVGVRAGLIDTRTNISNLRLIEEEKGTAQAQKKQKKAPASTARVSKIRDFSPEINLLGKTGDEAWFAVDKYLDDAVVSGIRTVRLIHGKGTGALRAALWRYLKEDNRIASFRLGQFGEGDSGVTVVELK